MISIMLILSIQSFVQKYFDDKQWKNIRVFFDLNYTLGYKAGEREYFGYNVNNGFVLEKGVFVQNKSLIFNNRRIYALKQTLNNMERFLNRIIKVIPSEQYKFRYRNTLVESHNIDLYIYLFVKPLSALGQGQVISRDIETSRPILGVIGIDPAIIGEEPQDFHSFERNFFEILFHEVCHVLGLNGEFDNWINPETGEKYGKNIKECISKYDSGKVHKLLITPKSVKYLKHRFGVERFSDDCEVGLELEDKVSPAHISSRVYYTEIMAPVYYGPSKISNVTLNLIEDMGYYKVDKSIAEPLEFGDYRSIPGSKIFKDFPLGPPSLVYPKHYLIPLNWTNYACTFDHKGLTIGMLPTYSKYDKDSSFYNFYDPNKTGLKGRKEFDYTHIGFMVKSCQNKRHYENGNYYGGIYFGPGARCVNSSLTKIGEGKYYGGMCYQAKCDKNYRFSIIVDGIEKVCMKKGMELYFEGYKGSIICPDPKIVCGIDNYPNNYNNDYESYSKEHKRTDRDVEKFNLPNTFTIQDNGNGFDTISNSYYQIRDLLNKHKGENITFHIKTSTPVYFPIDEMSEKNVKIYGNEKRKSQIIFYTPKFFRGNFYVHHKTFIFLKNIEILQSTLKEISFYDIVLINCNIKGRIKITGHSLEANINSLENCKNNLGNFEKMEIRIEYALQIKSINISENEIVTLSRKRYGKSDKNNDIKITREMGSNELKLVIFCSYGFDTLTFTSNIKRFIKRNVLVDWRGNGNMKFRFIGKWKNIKKNKKRYNFNLEAPNIFSLTKI